MSRGLLQVGHQQLPQAQQQMRQLLVPLEFLEASLAAVLVELAWHLVSFAEAVAWVQSLPGVRVVAAGLIAAVGIDNAGLAPAARHVVAPAAVRRVLACVLA